MPVNDAVLETEITTDPRVYGYLALISVTEGGTKDGPTQDQDVANLLGAVRDGTNPPANPTADGGVANGSITVTKASIPSKEIWETIELGDMTALPGTPTAAQLSTERRQLAWLSGLPNIATLRLLNDDGSNGSVITNLQGIFPSGSGTRTRLIALAKRFGSRAEEKFGTGTAVQHLDIARVLGRG